MTLPALPAQLTSCPRPVVLPTGSLSHDDVERLWRRDRANLERCGVTLDSLVTYYQGLAREFAGAAR